MMKRPGFELLETIFLQEGGSPSPEITILLLQELEDHYQKLEAAPDNSLSSNFWQCKMVGLTAPCYHSSV